MTASFSGRRGSKDSPGWRKELAYALAQPELAKVEQNTEPACRAAYWLAVVLGHCRLEDVDLGELDGSLPEAAALAACRRFVRLVPAWCEDAQRLDKKLLTAQGLVEENDICFELLEARMEAWAAYVAIDEAYQVSVEDRSPRQAAFGQALDEVLDRLEEFDRELQAQADLLAAGIARYPLLTNWRESLGPAYREVLPWWLDGRLEDEAARIANDPETWLPRKLRSARGGARGGERGQPSGSAGGAAAGGAGCNQMKPLISFAQFFRTATAGQDPYPYQERFADAPQLPHLLRAPTGAGKTATAVLGWLWRWVSQRPDTPRRLVYCLPMRVLVEQSAREAKKWIGKLFEHGVLNQKVPVCLLMGGVEAGDWYLHPEKPAVLIGTQDMLLSRALNRGYAASRFHWPIDFGLLNNDCLWVFDEPQLMRSGVSTSAQLAGLRAALGTCGPCPSAWMSATLEPSWLDTIDFRGKFTGKPLELGKDQYGDDYDPERPLYKRMTAEKKLAPLGVTLTKEADDKEAKAVAEKILAKHREAPGTQTLVVLNTVRRAKKIYEALLDIRKKAKSDSPKLLLVHSRFRPHEREKLNEQLQQAGQAAADRIIVATQVVEAGVDISARTLVTELAPWASVVQRIGRCNRTGDDGPGRVFWIDLDIDKQAAPYGAEELMFARRLLEKLESKDVSPRALDDFKQEKKIILPFEHTHVVRRRDVLDLFDTSPDLSGNDIDVSRFVRSDDPDSDVQVFWRGSPPDNEWDAAERRRQVARRVELCNVPIGSFKTEFLGGGKAAFRFDYLDGKWREVGKKDSGSVVPGQVFWVVADQGGYDREVGWSPTAGKLSEHLLVRLPDPAPEQRGQRPEGFYDSDEWSHVARKWKTIADHTDDVVRELDAILHPDHRLPVPAERRLVLQVAARWHDWGKAHPVFQSGVKEQIDDPRDMHLPVEQRLRPKEWQGCSVVAKAPDQFWRRYTRVIRQAAPDTQQPEKRVRVKRFRHELASALGVLALERAGSPPPDWQPLGPVGRLLALYLIAAHHGKVRLSVRTMPDESPVPPDPNRCRFAAGLWDGDKLPAADLGENVSPREVELSLDAIQLGREESWSAGVLPLRDDAELGPFRLAYLEALLRAADCRASDEGEGEGDG
jgi:CRISPR-associated endonuclease/helicase Cas3